MTSIGMVEYPNMKTEQVALGIRSTLDTALMRCPVLGAKQINDYLVRNKGNGNATITLKKRGAETTITADDISALQVGATAQVKGSLGHRRIKPGTVVIVDNNIGVPQRVEDSNSDGVLWQTDGPAGPTYPFVVGSIDYNEGVVDFTFNVAITVTVDATYIHTDWSGFTVPITHTIVAGGGERRIMIIPDSADNYFDGIKNECEIAWFGKLTAADQEETTIGLEVTYFGDVSMMRLPLLKGEITDYPFHNA